MREVWVAGFPSYLGGADTELDHLIDLFRARGVSVVLAPMFGADPAMKAEVLARGCRIEAYRPDMFAGRLVLSFCNGRFLERLPEIVAAGRPAKVVWFNCMTWLFEKERAAHAAGLIDVFGFVSRYQKAMLAPQLSAIAPFRTFDYHPYFNAARIPWRYRPLEDTYRIGRISRDDAAKFAPDTWRIYDRVLTPPHLVKKVYILGHGPNAAARIGAPPAGLDWMTWTSGAIRSEAFFDIIDTLVHKTGGSRESYGRVLIEAYAHGVAPVVERDYAFPELVIHGETGFMASSSDEMSYFASRLAMEPDLHRRMVENGRRHLTRTLVDADRCWAGWEALFAEG